MAQKRHRRDYAPDRGVKLSERGSDDAKEREFVAAFGGIGPLLAFPQACIEPVTGFMVEGWRSWHQGWAGFGLDVGVPLSPGWTVPALGPADRSVVLLDHPVCVVYGSFGELRGIRLDSEGGLWDVSDKPVGSFGETRVALRWIFGRCVITHPRVVVWWEKGGSKVTLFRRGKGVTPFC